jgi:hypothetical protein
LKNLQIKPLRLKSDFDPDFDPDFDFDFDNFKRFQTQEPSGNEHTPMQHEHRGACLGLQDTSRSSDSFSALTLHATKPPAIPTLFPKAPPPTARRRACFSSPYRPVQAIATDSPCPAVRGVRLGSMSAPLRSSGAERGSPVLAQDSNLQPAYPWYAALPLS